MSTLITSSRTFGVITLALLLGSCTQLDSKGRNMQAGPEKFTFAGDLPAGFGIAADVGYIAIEPKNCQMFDFAQGKEITRQYGKEWVAPVSSQTQNFSFDIPLTYKEGICERKLGNVDLRIQAKHGELEWQKTYANGGFYIVNQLPAKATEFDNNGLLEISAQCKRYFMISNLYLQLDKFLKCADADSYLQRDKLPNKIVRLKVTLNSEEKPFTRGTWVEFPTGWKPCLGRGPDDKYGFCYNSPGVFKQFKMNGKICTIYPTCTESKGIQL